MAAGNYSRCLDWVLVHEGGFVNHPKDPGGATNKGVTQRTYNAYRRRMGLTTRSVKEITLDEVTALYREQYWAAVSADLLPAGIDYAVFDYAVHSGPKRAIKDLQRVIGAKPDGWIGNETLAKLGDAIETTVIVQLCEQRMHYVRRLRHWKTFGRGWTRRIVGQFEGAQSDDIGVLDRAVELARSAVSGGRVAQIPAPKAEAQGKALEEDAGAGVVVTGIARDPKWLGILGAFGSTLATVGTSSGPVAWALAGALVTGGSYLIYRSERGRLVS